MSLVLVLVGLPRASLANPTLVIDAQTGAVLHADMAGTPWYPASLTKLMTAYIVFQKLRDDPDYGLKTKIRISKYAASMPASKIGIRAGRQVRVGRALEALIIYSANDIAVALAQSVTGSVDKFATRMNATAKALGMSATQFRNPNGLPNDAQVTTARDLAILARAIFVDFPERAPLFAQKVLKWGKKSIRARNSLLRNFPGADGMKTGYVCASGYNLVASATRQGKRLIVVVLGAPSGQYRMAVAANLLEKAFARGARPAIEFGDVASLSNDASLFVRPANLRPQLCTPGGKAPKILKTANLAGWGVLFGHYTTQKRARQALRRNLAALRGVATRGSAAVVRGRKKSRNAAVLAGLSLDEVLAVCDHLAKGGNNCTTLNPKEISNPKAAWR
ncbi:MAG: D-alanyl-D-alanine carboxypeptidase family protein [Alphaproteobacteria bacterium]